MSNHQMDAATTINHMTTKGNHDTRVAAALVMKEEQLRILNEQNAHLLTSLNTMDQELSTFKQTNDQLNEECQTLREKNFEYQSNLKGLETQLKKYQANDEEKNAQLKVLTNHNTELLRLLEHEESQSATLSGQTIDLKTKLETLETRYTSLLSSAKMHEELATRATKDGQLRVDEIRLLRQENDQLRSCNADMKMKTQVEIEGYQEQLRVRKEKQYQLLEKLQQMEEAKRQRDDQVQVLEEKLKILHERTQELETQLQLETKAKRAQIDANKTFFIENGNLIKDKQDLQHRIEKAELERTRMEAENRDSAEQLREMAEKVFQLLERLKLAELGKTKALDGLRQKEIEMIALKKKNSRLLKEGTKEGKARVKSELDQKILQEQIQALKKHNQQLSVRCGDEVKAKLKEQDERKALEDKLKTMSSRIAFLLNKMQADEDAKNNTKEEMKKMQAQIISLQEKSNEGSVKLLATTESNRVVTEALRCKQDELDASTIQIEALKKKLEELSHVEQERGAMHTNGRNSVCRSKTNQHDASSYHHTLNSDSSEEVNSRYYVESKASHGGLLVLRAKRDEIWSSTAVQEAVSYLDSSGINTFLKRAQKATNTKLLFVERLGIMMTIQLAKESQLKALSEELEHKNDSMSHLGRKLQWLQEKLTAEEDAKRKTLLRYVHEVKSKNCADQGNNLSSLDGSNHSKVREEQDGILRLPDSGMGDEEVHAIAALLRSSSTVKELQLRDNDITNEGARAIAAVIGSSSCQLRYVDLRGNKLNTDGVKVLAEALERNDRTKHVYLHADGKIEGLGTTNTANGDGSTEASGIIGVETVCIIDVRDQINAGPGSVLTDAPHLVLDDFDVEVNYAGKKAASVSKVSGQKSSQCPTSLCTMEPKSAFKLKMTKKISPQKYSQNSESSAVSGSQLVRRPISAATYKKQKEKILLQRRKRQEEMKRLLQAEANWTGRAGGFDHISSSISPSKTQTTIAPKVQTTIVSTKTLPPISQGNGRTSSNSMVNSRTNSAPALHRTSEDESTQ